MPKTDSLSPPLFHRKFVKTSKNDWNEAAAICEAAQRPTMRFVAPKSLEQQDLLAIHRVRERLVSQRTGLCNQIRGLLAEYGIVLPQAIARLRRELIASMLQELRDLEERIKPYAEAVRVARHNLAELVEGATRRYVES